MIRLLAALLLLPTVTQAATCDAVNGSNPNLTIGAVTPLTLGKFTTPDRGAPPASVRIDAQSGIRTLAATLNINDSNRAAFGDNFSAAVIPVTGGAHCHFRISVTAQTVAIHAYQFYSAQQVSGSDISPIIQLDSAGKAEVRLGASLPIAANTTSADITGNIEVAVAYVDQP